MTTTRQRRTLTWGAWIVIGTWLLLRGAPSLVATIREAHGSLRDQVSLLERSRSDIVEGAAVQDSAARLKGRLVAQAPRLLAGNGPAEAADALAGLVSLAVSRGNGKLTRIEPVADSTARGLLRRVSLIAGLDADVRGLTAVLQRLATGDPVLTVESINVVVADPNAPAAAAELLRVELVVHGWYLPHAGA
jgi:hypothetical protein